MHPRHLLILIAVAMIVVGTQTAKYPPAYLAFPGLWTALAFAAGAICLLCVIFPWRAFVALSGALLVTICAGRSAAIGGEVWSGGLPTPEAQASFIIGGTVWLLIAVLLLVAWREYVIPWTIGHHA